VLDLLTHRILANGSTTTIGIRGGRSDGAWETQRRHFVVVWTCDDYYIVVIKWLLLTMIMLVVMSGDSSW
jgi:hypothetical protein